MASSPEIFLDTRGEAGIENFDDLARHFPKWADRAINSALSSEGYRLRKVLQVAFDQVGPSGHSWEKLHPYTMRLRRGYRNRPRKKRPKMITGAPPKTVNPLLKFKGGLRYRVDEDVKELSVGFVNAGAPMRRMLDRQARGYSVPVTRKMQKLFFALGLPLDGSTRELEIPGRPLIEPVFQAEREAISRNLERKFFENLERYAGESPNG
jgi:hypothetical protein